jgi:glycosyltransferase involved in cell wall biosynthesis
MNQPLVSVIVPTYNRSQLVLETLESIQKQTYPSLELLVIDDGSKDDTVAVVEQWINIHRERFMNVQLIANEQNKGKSGVVNQGFDLFTGGFVIVFDSDDLLLPDAIEKQIMYFQSRPALGALCGGAFLLSGEQKTAEQFHPMRERENLDNLALQYGDLFLKGNPVISSTVLMKRNVVKETGYFHLNLRVTHDWDYWIRVSRRFTFGFLNTPLIYYRVNSDGSISQNKATLFNEVLKLISMYGPGYRRSTMVAMIFRQLKYHLWMAKNDRSAGQFMKIMYRGFAFLIRYGCVGR